MSRRYHVLTFLMLAVLLSLSFISPFWLFGIGVFVPMFVADLRNHHNRLAINILNLIILVIGIVMMLVIAADHARIVVANHNGFRAYPAWYNGPLGLVPVLISWLVALIWSCTNPRTYR